MFNPRLVGVMRVVVGALISMTLLSGCAGSADRYPSLATRDAERAVVSEAGTPAGEQPRVASGEVIRTIAEVVERARSLHQEFQANQPEALRLARAARGSGPNSAASARALVAQAQLTSLGGSLSQAIGDLDLLDAQAAATFEPREQIKAAQDRLAVWQAEQRAAMRYIESEMAQ